MSRTILCFLPTFSRAQKIESRAISMAQASRTIARTVAAIYALTAVVCMALAYLDVKDIYREDIYFSHWLGRRAPLYLWEELVFYGAVLIAPAALLLFSSVGTFATSANRIRIFLIAFGITLPFVMAVCVPHAWGGRAALYVAGPTASIMASSHTNVFRTRRSPFGRQQHSWEPGASSFIRGFIAGSLQRLEATWYGEKLSSHAPGWLFSALARQRFV